MVEISREEAIRCITNYIYSVCQFIPERVLDSLDKAMEDMRKLEEIENVENDLKLTNEEKEIIKYMYENATNMADLIDNKLAGYGLSSNDVYSLFEKLGLIDIVY